MSKIEDKIMGHYCAYLMLSDGHRPEVEGVIGMSVIEDKVRGHYSSPLMLTNMVEEEKEVKLWKKQKCFVQRA